MPYRMKREASSIFSPRRRSSNGTTAFTATSPCERDAIQCCMKTADKTCCNNHAKVFNEEVKLWVCGIHDNMVKASGVCVICLEMMDNPDTRTRLECGHTLHKECASHLDVPCCPSCRRGIYNKYAKRLFTSTKVTPLIDDVFGLTPEKQKAFFDISGRVFEILKNMDKETVADEIMLLKTTISSFEFGMKTFSKVSGGINMRYGVMADWCEASTTAFSHVSEHGRYDGLEMFVQNNHFWVESNCPEVLSDDPPYVPADNVPNTSGLGRGFVVPPPINTRISIDSEDELGSPVLFSPVSPSVIRL